MTEKHLAFYGLLLTIVALMLAIKQYRDAKSQTSKLLSISDALSTKYLGRFPEYFPELARIITRAKHEILILSIFPTHGVFRAPENWLHVKHAIESALSRKVHVSCVFSNPANRRAFLENQFAKEKLDWANWKAQSEYVGRLKQLKQRIKGSDDIQNLTFEEFLDLWESACVEALRSTYAGAKYVEVDHRPTIYTSYIPHISGGINS
jgi:hypothetical protein